MFEHAVGVWMFEVSDESLDGRRSRCLYSPLPSNVIFNDILFLGSSVSVSLCGFSLLTASHKAGRPEATRPRLHAVSKLCS